MTSAPLFRHLAQLHFISAHVSLTPCAIMVPKAFQPGYPNTHGFRKVVKATIYIKKKEGMSDEDFIEYYNNNHAQRAVPILQKHGVLSYSLVCAFHNS
jgi:hypothetical protein